MRQFYNKFCQRCNKKINSRWAFCPNCGFRLLHGARVPAQPKGDRDVKFLQDLYSFGWYSRDLLSITHYESGTNLERYYQDDMLEIYKPPVDKSDFQKVIRVSIHAEFVALLEAFGYLCIAIRKRKTQSLIWTYLNTVPKEVSQLYDEVLSFPKLPSLAKFLKLPLLKQVQKARRVHPEISFPEVDKMGDENNIYQRVMEDIHIAAELYRDKPSLVTVKSYNKIKHGFTIVRGEGWINPTPDVEKAIILVDVNDDDAATTASFELTQESVSRDMSNIRIVTEIGAEFLAICIALHKLGILFT